jgi:outer membrane protein assembly factor BamD (BamD/ComL family)
MADALAEAASQAAAAAPRRSAAPATIAHDYDDVWSRAEPKYRFRALLLLVVTFGLFCGLCVFTHWVHTARLLEFTWDSYFAPMNFWSTGSPNLNDFILYPIDVTRTPVHALVLGIVLAAQFAVPICIAIMYRFPFSIPFALAVGAFAHMPWLAATLLLSCLIASVRPFRLKFHFGSALVGLLPVLLYLYLATRGGGEQLDQASPTQQALLAAPWILSILGACAMCATVLLISRAVNYRPGAIAPVLAVMFALPVALFHLRVGADELLFRVLEAEYGPRSPRFAPIADARPALRDMLRRLGRDDEVFARFGPDLFNALSGQATPLRRVILNQIHSEFLAQRAAAHQAFDRFRNDFPASRYIPGILYLHGWIMDMRLEDRALESGEPRRELYTDFPNVQSEPSWATLFASQPNSPLAAAAGLRLAQLDLRRGDTAEARRILSLVERLAGKLSAPRPAAALQPETIEASLNYDPTPYLIEARRLAELIDENRDDPRFGDRPLVDLAGLDRRRTLYRDQLARLAQQYQGAVLHDNLIVLWIAAAPEIEQRRALFAEFIDRTPDGDGRAEALCRLADIELQAAGERDPSAHERAIDRLRSVARDYPGSAWAADAKRRLESIDSGTDPPERQ